MNFQATQEENVELEMVIFNVSIKILQGPISFREVTQPLWIEKN